MRTSADIEEISSQWEQLQKDSELSLFAGPTWILSWWNSYAETLGATPFILAAFDHDKLVAILPLYRRRLKKAGLKVDELRLMGDAGPRPASIDITTAKGTAPTVGTALASYLLEHQDQWDVLSLEPFTDPSPVRARFASRLGSAGCKVMSRPANAGTTRLSLQSLDDSADKDTEWTSAQSREQGCFALRRISAREWAHVDEVSPYDSDAAASLLVNIAGRDFAHVHHYSEDGRAQAVAVSIDDSGRATMLAMGTNPDSQHYQRYGRELVSLVATASKARGASTLDVVMGASAIDLPRLPSTKVRAVAITVYSKSKTATIAAAYGKVAKSVGKAQRMPEAAASKARAAWARIAHAAGSVAASRHFQLYRGELWTKGAPIPSNVNVDELTLEQAQTMDNDHLRASFERDLELDWPHVMSKLSAGDLAIVAYWEGAPAGIAWAATRPLHEPRLKRQLHLAVPQAYIHDLFVASHARGKGIARILLDSLSETLRQRDVYQSWALIESSNIAAARAFEKSAYLPIADVKRKKVGTVDRLSVKPPDPGARRLLGLD